MLLRSDGQIEFCGCGRTGSVRHHTCVVFSFQLTSSTSTSSTSSQAIATMMFGVRTAALLVFLVAAAAPESAFAYVVPSPASPASHAAISASPKRAASAAAFAATRPFGGASTSIRRRAVLSLASSNDEDGFPIDAPENGRISRRKRAMARARTFGQLLKERLDTMDAAFGDADVEDISAGGNHPSSGGGDAKGLVPMQAGVVKTGIQIAIAFWLFKKIKKVSDDT